MKGYQDLDDHFKCAKKGDRKCKELLLLAIKPLIISSIKRYYNDYNEYDDLIQDGFELALKYFNEKSITEAKHFLGFLKRGLKFRYIYKLKKRDNALTLNKELDDGSELLDLIDNGEEIIEDAYIKKENMFELWSSLDRLSKREIEVIYHYYMQDKNMYEIADVLGISYRTVVNIKVNAIKKLKRFLKNYND